MSIKLLESNLIFDNDMPHLRSRHGYFPGLTHLENGDLLALFVMGEAFEAVNCTTCIARSCDQGRTWQVEGALYDKSQFGRPVSDAMKPTLLRDGTLLAMGYWYYRDNPDLPIGNPDSGGVLPGDIILSFSTDKGRSWTLPKPLPCSYPELIEVSGPALQLRSGDILAAGALFKRWDGSMPSGQKGVLLRSGDGGRNWNDGDIYFASPSGKITPFETRICEMQDGRIAALVWAFDQVSGRSLNNHITLSDDDGRSWSAPLDIGIRAQASNLLWLGGDSLLTVQAHREGQDIGLYVRRVSLSGGDWRILEEARVWCGSQALMATGMADIGKALRFGQPSLLQVDEGLFLLTHWSIEEGQGRILAHRLSLR